MNVIVLPEKHGSRYFVTKDNAGTQALALRILKERLAEPGWYQGEDKLEAANATRSGKSALRFLMGRTHYEYEGFEEEWAEVVE